ncbi:cytochrome P450 [Mycena belliarum]|uniref:Cytochrome P450 n=1 Tax=Mycena belliarum TaxID=1033014 RepID=A0AAD6TXG9_9AGAR|nr:cytochrome P450 [Mycena belliae]
MPLYVLFAASLVSTILWKWFLQRRGSLPLPPGPPKLPLVGNLFQMPSTLEWETYSEWSKSYGSDIIHINAAGTSILVLSSAQAASDLLEKRSSIYSDRPRIPMANELMGWDFALGFMKYGEHWRKHRRLFHEAFNANAARNYQPKEREACNELLRRLLRDPADLMVHLRHMAGEIIMAVAFGIEILPQNDPYVALAQDAMHTVSIASIPGRFLVDAFPLLKHVPDWFPGAEFKRTAREWRKLARAMIDLPFAEVKRTIAAGNAPASFTSTFLGRIDENAPDREEKEQVVKAVAGSMYAAGADTTVSAIGTFVLAMLANPEAQKKAQMEIDAVVGNGRLPDFGDQDSLPYVSALVQEVFRWKNVTPIAVPHFLPVEDEYKGYRLPAGSIVIANTWAILHDEAAYPDPFAFKPERFLLDGKRDPAVPGAGIAFGFGRRICPGKHLASSSVWITAVSILASFDITKAIGEDGQTIEPTYEYFPGLVSMPLPFKCSIKPRSQRAMELIHGTTNEEGH